MSAKPLSVWLFGAYTGQRDTLYAAKRLAEQSEPDYRWVWVENGENSWIGRGKHGRAEINTDAPMEYSQHVIEKYARQECYTDKSYLDTFGHVMNKQDWIEVETMSFEDGDTQVFYRHWRQVYKPHEVPYMMHELLELQRKPLTGQTDPL